MERETERGPGIGAGPGPDPDPDPPSARPRILFVTGRLAEFALRRMVDELAAKLGFDAEIAVMPITVAALMPAAWVAKRLVVPPGVDRVVLPGHCGGDLEPIRAVAGGATVERGPVDLRDLPEHFGLRGAAPALDGSHRLEILAEINHAPRLSRAELVEQARSLVEEGADLVDLGCEPGLPWSGVGDAVAALRDLGIRVSIDSFDPGEVAAAVRRGAELVLSVNASNRERAPDWGAEVVVVPDAPGTLDGLDETAAFLAERGVKHRLDPILEPIGFGFAASLERYLDVRRRHPDAEILMGVGNLTELTDVDSAGVNVLLAGFCREVGVRSVLTTRVINWARSSVRELDLARRLVHHAVERRVPPKRLEPRLVVLRDPRLETHGPENLAELARRIRDPNWRVFAEDGLLHVMNNRAYLKGTDPFELFERMGVDEPSHAFYLGWEMMKAKTALLLGKNYRQDRALEWGHLTEPEESHRERRARRRAEAEAADPPRDANGPGPATPPRGGPEPGPESESESESESDE